MLDRRVPRSILERGKRGFEAPIGEWLRGPLAPMADALLGDGRLRARGIFNEREMPVSGPSTAKAAPITVIGCGSW